MKVQTSSKKGRRLPSDPYMNGPVKKRSLAISAGARSNSPDGAFQVPEGVPSRARGSVPSARGRSHCAGARSREPEALFQEPKGVPFALARVPGRAIGSVPGAQRAFQGRIIGRRYYLLPTNFAFGTWVARLIAAPLNQRATKASALPKNQKFSGAPRFYLPIRGQFQSLAGVPSALRRVPGIF